MDSTKEGAYPDKITPTEALARARQFVRGSLDRWAEEPGLLAAGERDAYQMALNVIEGREPLDNRPIEQAAEAVCSPLCGASKAYGRFDSPWKHEPECPIRLAAEAADREAAASYARIPPSAAVAIRKRGGA